MKLKLMINTSLIKILKIWLPVKYEVLLLITWYISHSNKERVAKDINIKLYILYHNAINYEELVSYKILTCLNIPIHLLDSYTNYKN